MSNPDPHADRGARLIEALRQQREQALAYPLTAAALRDLVDPQASDDEWLAALTKKPIAAQVVLAAKKDLASPLALAEDAAALAANSLLLEYALGKLATAERPLVPPAKLAGKVDKALRPAFTAAIEEKLTTATLPEAVGTVEVKGKVLLYLKRLPPPPPKKSPAVVLAEQLLAELTARHERGQPAPALAELAGPDVKPALLKKALAEEPIRSRAVVVPVSKKLSLASLAAGREALLSGDALLLALLEARTTARKPWITLEQLADGLSEDQRETFLTTQGRKVASSALPPAVFSRIEGEQRVLALKAHLSELLILTEKLLAGLRRRRDEGDYPATLESLLHSEAPEAGPDAAAKLSADKSFKTRVVQAQPGNLSAPVVLAGDEERLASDPRLLEIMLASQRSADNQVVPAASLGKKLAKNLKPGFTTSVEHRLRDGSLPASVGCLVIRKKPHLFLLADLGNRAAAVAGTIVPGSPGPAIDFAQAFATAFEKLDRERGAHGLVSLVWLRREIPVPREEFDQGLNQLRRARLYTLSAAEGRQGITPEEQEAGIHEHGSLLLFVSRVMAPTDLASVEQVILH